MPGHCYLTKLGHGLYQPYLLIKYSLWLPLSNRPFEVVVGSTVPYSNSLFYPIGKRNCEYLPIRVWPRTNSIVGYVIDPKFRTPIMYTILH